VQALRIAGAGAVGAVLGVAVSSIWRAGSNASTHVCAETTSLCFGPLLQFLAYGAAVVIAGIWVSFAVLRIRPMLLTVPAGVAITAVLVGATDAAESWGFAGPPAWAVAIVLAVGLALLAMAFGQGRLRIVGLTLLALLVIAALIAP
jgi:hypothetical protein